MGELLEHLLKELTVVLRRQAPPRSPGSRVGSFYVHWGLRLRKTAPELALSFRCMLPSAQVQRRQRLDWGFSKFDSQPTYSPVYASCRSSWSVTQNSGPSGSLIFTRKDSSSSASYRLSGKAMARTGLRMMPTFPLPPLKFRTAGFPRYGFKAGLSESAFPSEAPNCRAPLVCVLPSRSSLSNLLVPARCRGSCALEHRHSSDHGRSTPGVLAPVRVILSRSLYA